MEIFAYHPMRKKWLEIGNSGMFRPEMLEPMGFPKDVRVHGWGLSLERPTMIRCVRFNKWNDRIELILDLDTHTRTSDRLLDTV